VCFVPVGLKLYPTCVLLLERLSVLHVCTLCQWDVVLSRFINMQDAFVLPYVDTILSRHDLLVDLLVKKFVGWSVSTKYAIGCNFSSLIVLTILNQTRRRQDRLSLFLDVLKFLSVNFSNEMLHGIFCNCILICILSCLCSM